MTSGKIAVVGIIALLVALLTAALSLGGLLFGTPVSAVLLVVLPLFAGWLYMRLLHWEQASARAGVLTGILAPLPGLAVYGAGLRTLSSLAQRTMQLGQEFAVPGAATTGSLSYLFGWVPPALWASIAFYVLINAFVAYAVIKAKDKAAWWYLLAPVAFIVSWGFAYLVSTALTSQALVS